MQAIKNILFFVATLYIYEKFRDYNFISLANWIACATISLLVVTYFWNRFTKLRFFGREYPLVRNKTKGILANYTTQNMIAVYCLAVIGIIIEACHFLLHFNWLVPGFFFFVDSFMRWTRLWEPPIALYLAASERDQFQLCAKLVNPMWPLRVATLLQARDASRAAWFVSLSDLRSYKSDSTQYIDIVEKVMCFVRVIIVDARHESAAVAEEIEAIKRNGFQYKTIGDFQKLEILRLIACVTK